jgi:hypothetical protein
MGLTNFVNGSRDRDLVSVRLTALVCATKKATAGRDGRGEEHQVRVQQVDKLGVTEIRMWGAYEKVSARRASAEEVKITWTG